MAFPDGVADFRSDTVTRPTDVMRRAMAEAEAGILVGYIRPGVMRVATHRDVHEGDVDRVGAMAAALGR
jgi:hypothetical protein